MSRLSREDWAAAALHALGEGGLSAVSVEPLAARLGTTKGSFYWHFQSREELITAALERWRQAGTASVIEGLQAQGETAAQRLRLLFERVFDSDAHAGVDLALLADSSHPLVAPLLREVTETRLRYVTELFGELGFSASQARRRALFAYSAYLGHLQLLRCAPGLLPGGAAATAYADELLDALRDRPGHRP